MRSRLDYTSKNQCGFTGLDLAIVFVSFVLVVSVLGFAVLSTGLVASERSEQDALGGLGEIAGTFTLINRVTATSNTALTAVDEFKFQMSNSSRSTDTINLSLANTVLSYIDADQAINCTGNGNPSCSWTATWLNGSGSIIDPGEVVEIAVDLTGLIFPLGTAKQFFIYIRPSEGAEVMVTKTTPAKLTTVMDLSGGNGTDAEVAAETATPAFEWIPPVPVTPSTAGSWQDVNVSAYIPDGATGVILHYNMQPPGADKAIGFRKNGSTDNRIQNNDWEIHSWALIGVDANRTFEAYVGALSIEISLVGYTNSGVVFFDNSVDKTLGSGTAWKDIEISGDSGEDTAIGVILEVTQSSTTRTWGVRKKGSSDNRDGAYARMHRWAIVGVDENEVYEGRVSSTTNIFHVLGYVTSGAVFFTDAVDVTPTTGSWVDVDVSGSTGADKAAGVFVEMYDSDSDARYGFRKNGSLDNTTGQSRRHAWGFVEVGPNEVYEAYLSAEGPTHSLIGYSCACSQ